MHDLEGASFEMNGEGYQYRGSRVRMGTAWRNLRQAVQRGRARRAGTGAPAGPRRTGARSVPPRALAQGRSRPAQSGAHHRTIPGQSGRGCPERHREKCDHVGAYLLFRSGRSARRPEASAMKWARPSKTGSSGKVYPAENRAIEAAKKIIEVGGTAAQQVASMPPNAPPQAAIEAVRSSAEQQGISPEASNLVRTAARAAPLPLSAVRWYRQGRKSIVIVGL